MIENARISVICGGFYHCTPKWNRNREEHPSAFDKLFGFWLPVSGGACVETITGEHKLSAGHLYFISGHHMLRQTCEKEMSVYWISFVSESYYLHHRLLAIQSVPDWPLASLPWVKPVFQRFVDYFEEAETDDSRLPQDPPAGLSIKIEGVLMYLVADLIDSTEADCQRSDHSDLMRLKPAIDFMDQHFLRNPSLAEIAGALNLSPNYFHRFFKRVTGMTAFDYLENRRLDVARKLLFDRRLTVKEVADRSGYHSPAYFSRAFSRRFGLSPAQLRRGP